MHRLDPQVPHQNGHRGAASCEHRVMGNLRRLWPWLKGLLGAGLLVYLLLAVDWQRAATDLREADPAWLLLGILVTLVLLALKALRWWELLNLVDVHPPALTTLEAYLAGQALNILLPFRGGEVARLGMIGAARPGKVPESASSIVAEKALDVVGLLALIGVLFTVLPSAGAGQALSPALPRLGALSLVAGLGLILVFALWPRLELPTWAISAPVGSRRAWTASAGSCCAGGTCCAAGPRSPFGG